MKKLGNFGALSFKNEYDLMDLKDEENDALSGKMFFIVNKKEIEEKIKIPPFSILLYWVEIWKIPKTVGALSF